MLSMMEEERLKRMMLAMGMVDDEEDVQDDLRTSGSWDVSHRQRDDHGRFLANQSDYPEEDWSSRSIRLVKQPGTYGTYTIKDGSPFAKLLGVGALIFLCIAYLVK